LGCPYGVRIPVCSSRASANAANESQATSRRPGAYAERWKRVAAPLESQGMSAAVMRERD